MIRLHTMTFAPSDGVGSSVSLPEITLGNIPEGTDMPSQSLTIQDQSFVIPAPFVAGIIELTVGEAAALNQVYAENIRNNFAGQIKKAAEETPARQLGQSELNEYVKGYAFGKRSGGVRSRDPIGAEERRLAKDALHAHIVASGKKVKDYSAEQINEMVSKIVAAGKFRAQAEAVVAARASAVDPLADFEVAAPAVTESASAIPQG